MYAGKRVFTQLMDHLLEQTFSQCIAKYLAQISRLKFSQPAGQDFLHFW